MTGLDYLTRTEWAKLDHAVISLRLRQGRRRPFQPLFFLDLDVVFSAITTTFFTVVDQSNLHANS